MNEQEMQEHITQLVIRLEDIDLPKAMVVGHLRNQAEAHQIVGDDGWKLWELAADAYERDVKE